MHRYTLKDVIRSLFQWLRAPVPPKVQPEREPAVPDPLTPLERLEAELADLGVKLHDLRDLEKWPRDREYDWRVYGWPPNKKRARPHGTRTWNQVTCVWLHTYGASGMSWERFLGVPCHAGICSNGDIVLCHDVWQYIYHGDAANSFSYGIEVSGPGKFDNPEIQTAAGKALLRYVEAERQRNVDPNGPYVGQMSIGCHRMSAREKAACCGRQVWQALGEWSIKTGLFKLGPVVGSGQSVDIWR